MKPKVQPRLLFTSADVGKKLGCTGDAVREARKRGDIVPAVTTPGGVCLFDQEGVDAFAAQREGRRKMLERAAEE